MQRNYKACEPEETIQNARNLLSNVGIFLHESNWSHGNGLYNCRVHAHNDNLDDLGIGTNGKGRTYEYSLASGYAEYLERVENEIHFDAYKWKNDLKNISKFTKDEMLKSRIDDVLSYYDLYKTESIDNLWEKYSTDFKGLFPDLDTKESAEEFLSHYFDTKAIPVTEMYDVINDKIVEYPLLVSRISAATSGLCSGNTPKEALLHGFCEIFERYVTTQIFEKNLTPPTIPTETYKGTNAWNTIQILEKEYGLQITLKDCSLGLGLPVIGLLVVDPKKQIFNFKLGSEFVSEIALERCLTEAFQTTSNAFKAASINHSLDTMKTRWYKILKYGCGEWPNSIFGNKPSYPLWIFDENYGLNDDDDIQTCIRLCDKLNTNVYIKDNSFLGFPSYQIIAPQISRIIYDTKDIPNFTSYVSKQMDGSVFSDGIPSDEKVAEFLKQKAVESMKQKDKFYISRMIPYYYNKQLSALHPLYILSLASYIEKNYDEAYDYICKYIEKETNVAIIYHAFADFLCMKNNNEDDSSIIGTLTNKYGRNTGIKIWAIFSNPNNVFSAAGITDHFNFDEWCNNSDSHLYDALKIINRIQKMKHEYTCKNSELAEIFNG